MLITLVRHAESRVDPDRPISDWTLTDEGSERAFELGRSPLLYQVDTLYASPQRSAQLTMEAMSSASLIPVHEPHPGLDDISSFTGRPVPSAQYLEDIVGYYTGTIDRINGGETRVEALQRFFDTLELITEAESLTRGVDNVGIVSHGVMLALFTGLYTEQPALYWHDHIAVPDVAVFDWRAKRFEKLWGVGRD